MNIFDILTETDGYDPTWEDIKQLRKTLKMKRHSLKATIDRYQSYIDQGTLDPEMPVFTLFGCDICAPSTIEEWCDHAIEAGTPIAQIDNAREIIKDFEAWHTKQVPGRPETKVTTVQVVAMES